MPRQFLLLVTNSLKTQNRAKVFYLTIEDAFIASANTLTEDYPQSALAYLLLYTQCFSLLVWPVMS